MQSGDAGFRERVCDGRSGAADANDARGLSFGLDPVAAHSGDAAEAVCHVADEPAVCFPPDQVGRAQKARAVGKVVAGGG